MRNYIRALVALLSVGMFVLATVSADAAPRFNAGSRGSRTYSAPPPTATAPKPAQPIQRSITQPGAPGSASAARPAPATTGGLFSRPGILGGLAAGFLGAGLFGLLFGHGLFGNIGGFASMFGLLLQIAVVFLIARLLWSAWQRRNAPAFAGPANRGMSDFGNRGMGMSYGGQGGPAPQDDRPLQLTPEDFDSFERLLGEIMTAYGAEDVNALRARTTPEMLSYYSEELARNVSKGDINPISDVKLLQGDLSEAWSEDDDDYATVSMRYSADDRIVDRNTSKLIEQLPSEATELWTFRRSRGGQWLLTAIQQAN